MATERKNIRRNARRPSVNMTPFLTAKSGSGRKSEQVEIEIMQKLNSWNNLEKKSS